MTIFVDRDGVLANFDKSASAIVGMNHYKATFILGDDEMWKRIHSRKDFFVNLDPMDDMPLLWTVLRRFNPWVLTALPRENSERAAKQKQAWVQKHLTPKPPVVTCYTKDKVNYCSPGDILIDDREVVKAAWEAKGGHYITHTSAADTILQLGALGVL